MPEHWIRLRGGWEWVAPGEARRVTLPLDGFGGPAGRVRLERTFGRPPLDPGGESLWLALGGVEGLASVALNGRPLGGWRASSGEVRLRLEDLPARNRLVLEVDPPPALAGGLWGEVALVIVRGEGSGLAAEASPG